MNKSVQSFVTPYWRVVITIARKDIKAELRGFEMLSSMILFALLAVVIFSFALELDREARESVVAGVLWVTILFASMLGFSRSMAVEKDKGSLDALLIAPIQRSALFYGKLLANLLFTLIISGVLMVVVTVLFNISLFDPLVVLTLILGCLGFTTTGTLLASIAIYARARDNVLPIVLLPVNLPVILCAVRATSALLNGLESVEWMPWLRLLVVVDIVFLLGTFFLFDYVVEE